MSESETKPAEKVSRNLFSVFLDGKTKEVTCLLLPFFLLGSESATSTAFCADNEKVFCFHNDSQR